MHDIVIKNGLCFLGNGFIQCNVGIDGEKITYVGKKDVKGDIEFDAKNHLVLPGFFNAHTHAAMTMLRGYAEDLPLKEWLEKIWSAEAKLDEKDIYWGTMLACVEMLKTGTTGFADMYIYMDGVAEAVGECGIRAVLGYGMADRGEEERGERELEIGMQFIKKWENAFNGRIKTMLTPHAPYTCSPEFLKKIQEISSERGIVKHIHVSETRWEVEEIKKRYGSSPIRMLDRIGFLDEKTVIAHAVWLDDDEIEVLVRRGVSVAHCPASNLKLSSGVARISEMLRQGVNVCIGTDGAASNNTLNMVFEMRLAALLQSLNAGKPETFDFIRMAGENGYRAYGLRGGKIEKDFLADLIVVEKSGSHHPLYNPAHAILYASSGCEVVHSIINGEPVMEEKILLEVDEDRIYGKVEERAEKFRK